MSLTRFCDRCGAESAHQGPSFALSHKGAGSPPYSPPKVHCTDLDLCPQCSREFIAEVEEWWNPELAAMMAEDD